MRKVEWLCERLTNIVRKLLGVRLPENVFCITEDVVAVVTSRKICLPSYAKDSNVLRLKVSRETMEVIQIKMESNSPRALAEALLEEREEDGGCRGTPDVDVDDEEHCAVVDRMVDVSSAPLLLPLNSYIENVWPTSLKHRGRPLSH